MYGQLKNIFIYLTFILGCFPILTFGIRSVLTILWGVLGISMFFLSKKNFKFNIDIIIFIFPYILILLSLFYSTNKEYGVGILTKMLSLIIFPLVFYLNINFFSKKKIYKILDLFSFSILILILFQLVQVLINFDFISSNITLQEIKSNGYGHINEIANDKIEQIRLRRFRNFIIKISNTHTTYQGIWVCLTIFYLGLKSFFLEKKYVKIINIFIILILIFWLYLISARMPFFALVVSLILVVIIFSKLSSKKKLIISLIPFFGLVTLLLFKNPFSTRVKEYYNTGLTLLEKSSKTTEFNSSNVRNGVYYCDLLLIREFPFFGIGIGDVQDKLNECYTKKISSKVYTWRDYNSHNQYLFFWLSSGFLGFMLFCFFLFYCFKKSLKYSKIIYFYFLVLVTLVFFTENLLSRSDGVIFFSFFNSLLFFNAIKKDS